MSGKKTISSSTPAIGAIKIQQSTYGVVLPIVWGRARISGNLIWYGDFKAVPHTTTTESGGKGGGGVTQKSTTYTYTASVAMALCEGPILDVVTTWRGKQIFQGRSYTGAPEREIDTTTYPAPGTTFTVANTNGWAPISVDMQVSAAYADDFRYNRTGSWITLINGVDYSCTNGVYTFNNGSTLQGSNLRITYTYQSNASGTSCLSQIGLGLFSGTPGQIPWGYLSSAHADQALGYSGVAYVVGANYSLDSAASVENHSFEVQTGFSVSSTIPDADPSVIVQDALTNPSYGANFGLDRIGPLLDYSNSSLAQGIVLSPALTEQSTVAAFLDAMAQLTNVGMVWSGGVLKFVPFTDTQVTGNGVTYTPVNAPVYDLTDDDFQQPDNEGPVRVKRGAVSDSYNSVKLEYCDRSNDYNLAIMEQTDQADIQENGLRAMPVVTAHWITDTHVAKIVATLILQRSMFIRNTYEFKLGWTKIALEPMDIVTITDANLGLNLQPVRILTIEEDEDGYLSVTAEDFPKGSASATLYPTGSNGGYTPDFNEDPGQVTMAPVIFEGPAALASNNSGLEVWLAAGSLTATYGGCEVWVSLTGQNYQYATTLHGSSRFGTTTSALGAGSSGATTTDTVGVSLAAGGQMLSGTLADAQSLTTLCYADGEFFAYEAATLTGASAYTIGNHMVRGAFLSNAAAHASGVPFVRCDEAIAKVPLTADYIGKTIHIKLLAFNRYGGALTSLSDATEYTYTVAGTQANLPPIAPLNLGVEAAFSINTARFKWDRIANAATYNVQIWAGSPSAKVREVNAGNALRFDYSAADAKVDGGPWRNVTIKVQGVNANGAAGAFSSFTATNPQIGALTGAAVNSNSSAVQFTCDRPTDADFSGVRVYLSATSGFTPDATSLVYDGPNTNVTINRTQAGALLVAGTTYYVRAAAYDTFGTDNLTFTSEMSVTISNVTPVQSATVFLYQYATTPPSGPTGSSTYTWATGAHTAYSPAAGGAGAGDNWTLTGGSNPGTPGAKLYVAVVQVTAPTGTTSSTVSWGSATVAAWAQNGLNGANAIQTATPTVYRWDVSAPAGPSGSVSYRWSDGVFGPTPLGSGSVAPTNWSLTPGTAPSPGYTLYAAKVSINDSAANSTTAFNWTSATVSAIGVAPYAGSSYVTAYCASSSTTATGAPAATTGQSSLPAANSGGITGSWSPTVPALTTSQYLYQVDGIYNPANNTVTWSTPYWSSLKVGSLSAISANLGAITAGSLNINNGVASISATGDSIFKSIQIQDGNGNILLSSGNTGSIPTSISAAANTAVWSGVSGTGKPQDNATVGANASNFAATLGGDNLLSNSSFESRDSITLRPLGYSYYNNAQISTSFVDVAGRTGGKAFAIHANAAGASTWGLYTSSDIADGVVSGGVRGGWQPNKTYVISFKAKKLNGAGLNGIALQWNTPPASTTWVSSPSLTTSWQIYTVRITWGASVEAGGHLYLDSNNNASGSSVAVGDEFHVDELIIQEGDVYSEWFPSATEAATLSTWSGVSGTGKPADNATVSGADAATALGFNPQFSDWTGTYPAGWGARRGPPPTKGKGAIPTAPHSVKHTVFGETGMVANYGFPTPLAAGTIVQGSFDINVVTDNGGGSPGYLVRLFTNAAQTVYTDTQVVPPNKTAGWQHVPFVARVPTGQQIWAITIYQMASWHSLPGGQLADGSVCIFDNLTFDFYDSSIDNRQQQWTDVSGSTKPADNATAGNVINIDPNFANSSVWTVSKNTPGANVQFNYAANAPGQTSPTCVLPTNPAGTGNAEVWILENRRYPISSAKTYRLAAYIYSSSGNDRMFYLAVNFYDVSGNQLGTGWGGTWSGYPVSGVPTSNSTFNRYKGDFGANTANVIPAGAVTCSVGIILNYNASGYNGGVMAAQGFVFTDITDGATIGVNVSGQITPSNASTFIASAAIQSAMVNDLRTSNYAEDGSGNPTAGGKLASGGTALKVAAANLQVGSYVFTDYFFRILQGIDGNIANNKVIWRGNNDASTRGGAPNIACLSVYTQCDQIVQSDFQQTYLTYTLTPTSYTSYTDNLDAMTQIHIQFFASTASTGGCSIAITCIGYWTGSTSASGGW